MKVLACPDNYRSSRKGRLHRGSCGWWVGSSCTAPPSDSIVTHWGALFMYGGFMGSGHASKDLWSGGGRCQRLGGDIHNSGHTANNRMILIFRHSPKYGYLDTVQDYHFGTKE